MSVTGAALRLGEGGTVSVGAALPTCSGFLASQEAVTGLCRARGPLRATALDRTAESTRGFCVGEVARARDLEKAAGQGLCKLAEQLQEWFIFDGE